MALFNGFRMTDEKWPWVKRVTNIRLNTASTIAINEIKRIHRTKALLDFLLI